ncbi:unnamed protein product [Calicophoron daubneyi]|uniref:Receptor L-domain domain-containing protein n=1 Tax=Calicophoron daubneyi TaxID=300641 RepID=A0AAV2TZV7_CALDB
MTAKRTASLHVFAFLFGTLTFIVILCGLLSTPRRTGRESFEYAELGDSSVNSHHYTVQTAYDKQIAEYEQASFLLQYIANSAPSDDLVVPQSAQPDASDMGYSNPYEDDPKYVGKKVCRSDSTYKDMAIPWFEVRQKLETNCSLIYGNLVLSGITDADDVTQLLNIEEISGYLVIHRVGRRTLQLPKLKIIRGQEYVPKRSRKIAFLVSNNYHQTAKTDPQQNRRMALDGTGLETAANDGTIGTTALSFLQTLEIPTLVCILDAATSNEIAVMGLLSQMTVSTKTAVMLHVNSAAVQLEFSSAQFRSRQKLARVTLYAQHD